jgi:hypothetical protein
MEKYDKSTNESKPESSNDGSQGNKEEKPKNKNSKVDQELADEYSWTPQQAEEAKLYL